MFGVQGPGESEALGTEGNCADRSPVAGGSFAHSSG